MSTQLVSKAGHCVGCRRTPSSVVGTLEVSKHQPCSRDIAGCPSWICYLWTAIVLFYCSHWHCFTSIQTKLLKMEPRKHAPSSEWKAGSWREDTTNTASLLLPPSWHPGVSLYPIICGQANSFQGRELWECLQPSCVRITAAVLSSVKPKPIRTAPMWLPLHLGNLFLSTGSVVWEWIIQH